VESPENDRDRDHDAQPEPGQKPSRIAGFFSQHAVSYLCHAS
jgi:hypothetical protein